MKYLISWKIKMPEKSGGYLLSGDSRFDGKNLEDAIAHAKCCFMIDWPTSEIEVAPYGKGFSTEVVEIRKIRVF